MKIKVESIKIGSNPFGCGVLLTGGGYRLSMGIPDLTASKIHNAQNPGSPDGRMNLEDVLDQYIIQMGIAELRIDNISEGGLYSATLVVNGTEHRVIPSEGILLCILAGASIYFDSDLNGVKLEQDPQRVEKVAQYSVRESILEVDSYQSEQPRAMSVPTQVKGWRTGREATSGTLYGFMVMSEQAVYSKDPYIDKLISRVNESWKCKGNCCADSCDSHPCLLVSGKDLAG